MAQDEMLLVAMEEIAKQLTELKKGYGQNNSISEIDLSPIEEKITKVEQSIKVYRENVNHYMSSVDQIFNTIKNIDATIEEERPRLSHTYIEIKKPVWWIVGIIGYFLLSFALCFMVIQKNQKLKTKVELSRANDFKYRFIKLRNDKISEILKYAKTTSDWIYSVDDYYNENKQELEDYVLKKEEAIRREFEASELAKLKALEAKRAEDRANDLKKKTREVN